jgi:hypothetical protein
MLTKQTKSIGMSKYYNLVIDSKKRSIQHIREHTSERFEGLYRGFTIIVEKDNTWSEDCPRWYGYAFNSEIAFGTAVDGVFEGTMDDVIALCVENILP